MQNILLVECDANNTLLEQALKNEGFNILKIQDSLLLLSLAKEARPDAVIFNLDTPSEKLISDLHKLYQQFPLPVIMFAKDGSSETINKAIQAEVSAYLVDGLTGQRIDTVIQVAIAQFQQKQALKEALEEARIQLENRKQVDRAKAILIKTQKFTEDEAYHTLRKLAMDRNITLGEMARNVIAMAELLK